MILLLLGATLEGTVTDAAGVPIEGADVGIFDRRFRLPLGYISTDAAGQFSADLPDGTFRIRVVPPEPSTASEIWHGDTLRACESPPIDPAEQASITLQLPSGGGIRGSIHHPDRGPVADALIDAYPIWKDEVGFSTRSVETDEHGDFVVTGLPPDEGRGGFLFEVRPLDAPRHFYRSSWFEEEAETLQIPDGEIVDVGPMSLRAGATLSGTVLGPDGPVEGAAVLASNIWGGQAFTDAEGRWSMSGMPQLPTRIFALGPDLARTYWGDLATPTRDLEIPEDAVELTDLVFTLPPAGSVRGSIPDLVGPNEFFGGLLLADPDRNLTLTSLVEADGAFTFENLHAGVYTLEAFATESLGFVSGPVSRDGMPVRIEVEAGGTVDLGVMELEPAARVAGTVADDNGDPVRGAAVIIESAGGPRLLSFTEEDGSYEVNGIRPGSYDLQVGHGTFCTGDPTYVSVYWPDLVNPFVQRAVDLRGGETFDWDTTMPIDADGDEMADNWESANGLEVGRNDAEEDPDGDGFTNLDEYRLGTDPQQVYKEGCGCSGSGPVGWWWVFSALVLIRRSGV